MVSNDSDENSAYMTVTSVDNYSKTNEEVYQMEPTSKEEIHEEVVENEPSTGFNFKSKGDKIRFSILMVGTLLAMFMMSLNSTVVAPAITIIATDLNALSSQTWIATAYLVAINAFQPLSGKVSFITPHVIRLLFNLTFHTFSHLNSLLIFLEGKLKKF